MLNGTKMGNLDQANRGRLMGQGPPVDEEIPNCHYDQRDPCQPRCSSASPRYQGKPTRYKPHSDESVSSRSLRIFLASSPTELNDLFQHLRMAGAEPPGGVRHLPI